MISQMKKTISEKTNFEREEYW